MCDKSLEVLKEDKTLNNEDLYQVTGGDNYGYMTDNIIGPDYEVYRFEE